MKQQPEYQLQKQIAAYLRLKYPSVLFLSDTVAFLNLTMPQAVRNKQIQCSDFHCPDLIIFETTKFFSGLFLELKTKSPYKKDGKTLLKNEHVENQQRTIKALIQRGYIAYFAWDFEQAQRMIDKYMALSIKAI